MSSRYSELRQLLLVRQDDLRRELRGRFQSAQEKDARRPLAHDDNDVSADAQEDINLAVIQIQSDALNHIAEALVRLDHGQYGDCVDCGEQIAAKRLRALPFATRCRACEESREAEARRRSPWNRVRIGLTSDAGG